MVWGLQQGTQKGAPLEACTGVLIQQRADGFEGGSKGPYCVGVGGVWPSTQSQPADGLGALRLTVDSDLLGSWNWLPVELGLELGSTRFQDHLRPPSSEAERVSGGQVALGGLGCQRGGGRTTTWGAPDTACLPRVSSRWGAAPMSPSEACLAASPSQPSPAQDHLSSREALLILE